MTKVMPGHRPLRSRLPTLASLAIVMLFATVPYVPTLNDFFTCDDFSLIYLFWQKPLWHFLTLFTSPWTEQLFGYWVDELRPFLTLSYQLDALWGPTNPIGYHVTNILFHVQNVLLVYFIISRLVGLPLVIATLATAAFAVFPIHAETIAWISGRADSQPAVPFLATVALYAMWRWRGGRVFYWGAAATFAVALWSKQSAIIMVPVLLLYDLVVEGHRPAPRLSFLRPYLPFFGLTVLYLGLRLMLFGNVVREQQLTAERFVSFLLLQATYLQMMLSGDQTMRSDAWASAIAITVLAAGGLAALRALWLGNVKPRSPAAWALFFGPVWWVLTVGPLIVTYTSARHLYLTSVGFAVLIGLGLGMMWEQQARRLRLGALAIGLALLVWYPATLRPMLQEWGWAGNFSRTILHDVHAAAEEATPGTLLVIGAPSGGGNPANFTWIWGFATPFVMYSPWVPEGLAQKVAVIGNSYIYCCPIDQWHRDTVEVVRNWAARPEQPPVIVLDWDRGTTQLRSASSERNPHLREMAAAFVDTRDPGEMWSQYYRIIAEVQKLQ